MLKRQVAVPRPRPQWGARGRRLPRIKFTEKRAADDRMRLTRVAPIRRFSCCISTTRRAAQRRGVAGRRLHQGHARTAGRPDHPRRSGNPTGFCWPKPNANILLPHAGPKAQKLPFEYQVIRRGNFMRELNRSASPARSMPAPGSRFILMTTPSFKSFSVEGQLTIRLAYNLLRKAEGRGRTTSSTGSKTSKYKQGTDYFRPMAPARCWLFFGRRLRGFPACAPACPRRWKASWKRLSAFSCRQMAVAPACDL